MALVPLGLAACGGNGSGSSTSAPPTSAAVAFPDKFTTAVSTDYKANPFSEPVDPATGDVPALSLTTEPLDN